MSVKYRIASNLSKKELEAFRRVQYRCATLLIAKELMANGCVHMSDALRGIDRDTIEFSVWAMPLAKERVLP